MPPTVSGGVAHKTTPFKSVVLKARLISISGKNTGPSRITLPHATHIAVFHCNM